MPGEVEAKHTPPGLDQSRRQPAPKRAVQADRMQQHHERPGPFGQAMQAQVGHRIQPIAMRGEGRSLTDIPIVSTHFPSAFMVSSEWADRRLAVNHLASLYVDTYRRAWR